MAYPPNNPIPVKLVTHCEFGITGLGIIRRKLFFRSPKEFNKFVREECAITIPGEETDVLAEKAKQYRVYIAGSNLENDPEYPEHVFDTAFIINPQGKMILIYRKICDVSHFGDILYFTPHDVWDRYKNPITRTKDPFPVVDTEIGRLGCMICCDVSIPEIPRIYGIKGCEVLIRQTLIGNTPLNQAMLQAQAAWNVMYIINSNYAAEIIGEITDDGKWVPRIRYPNGGGGSGIYGPAWPMDWYHSPAEAIPFPHNVLIKAKNSDVQIVSAVIDIMKLRRMRAAAGLYNATTAWIKTELFREYYARTIWPPNKYLELGPEEYANPERQQEIATSAYKNWKMLWDWYSEKDIS